MAQFFKGLAIFLFIILAPTYIVLLSLKFSLPPADVLKTQLREQKIYQNLIADLNKEIDAASSSQAEEDEILRLLGPVLKQNLTADYLQGKIEKLIDDTDFWLKDKNKNAPSIAFPEIKAAIVKQDPNLIKEIEQLNQQSQSSADLSSIIKSDFSIPLGNYIGLVKGLYKMYGTWLIFEGIFLLILCGLIYWGTTPPFKLKPLSITFLITSILGAILLAIGWLLLKLISSPTQSVYLTFLARLSSIIVSRLLTVEAIVFGSLFAISLAGLLLPNFMVQKKVMSTSKNLSVNKKQKGLAPIIIILVIAAIGGVFVLSKLNIVKIKPPQLPKISQQQPETKPKGTYSKERQFGKAKITEKGEADVPVFGETVVNSEVDQKGTVLSTTLKNGVKAYLIITGKGSEFGGYAELGELAEFPTTKDVIPLYPSLGYGVSVFIDYVGLHPTMYLVFDFSKGQLLSKWQKISEYDHRCNYSSTYFQPEICAALLGIPADQTINKKYLVLDAGLNYDLLSRSASNKLAVLTPLPSYYLGTDELLVVGVSNRSTFVIPQPITTELVRDLASFQTEEAVDIVRNADYNYTDPEEIEVVAANYPGSPSFKTIYNKPYLEAQLNQAIAKLKEKEKNSPKKEEGFGFTLDVTSASLEDALRHFKENEYYQDPVAKALDSWKRNGDPSVGTVANAANLFRAAYSNLPNAEKVLLNALEREEQDLANKVDSWHELMYAFEQVLILRGDIDYREKLSANNSLLGKLASMVVKTAEATIWRPSRPGRPILVQPDRQKEIDDFFRDWLEDGSSLTKEKLIDGLIMYYESIPPDRAPTAEIVEEIKLKLRDRVIENAKKALDSDSCKEKEEALKCCRKYAVGAPRSVDFGACSDLIPRQVERCTAERQEKKPKRVVCGVKMYKTLKDFGDNRVQCREETQ